MSKRSAFALVVLLALAGCRGTPEAGKLCLDGDLGGFRLEDISISDKEFGCVARYRDAAGKSAKVHVTRDGIDLPDGGEPFEFEKHIVYQWPAKERVRLSWSSGGHQIDLTLEGTSVPGGPVLRAYLFAYRSEVIADLTRVEEDVENLRQAEHQNPRDAAIHLELARKYRKLGDRLMANQEYYISGELDRGCYPCYLEMGSLQLELDHYDLSIRAFRRAASIQEKNPEPCLLLGDVYYEVRNGQEALREYEKAVRLGLTGDGLKRAEERLKELRTGKYMIEVMPDARKPRPPKEPTANTAH